MGFVPTNKVIQQAIKAVSVTLDADLTEPGAVLFIGTGGDVKVTTIAGDVAVFKNLPDGSILPVHIKRVHTASTTASDLLALY